MRVPKRTGALPALAGPDLAVAASGGRPPGPGQTRPSFSSFPKEEGDTHRGGERPRERFD